MLLNTLTDYYRNAEVSVSCGSLSPSKHRETQDQLAKAQYQSTTVLCTTEVCQEATEGTSAVQSCTGNRKTQTQDEVETCKFNLGNWRSIHSGKTEMLCWLGENFVWTLVGNSSFWRICIWGKLSMQSQASKDSPAGGVCLEKWRYVKVVWECRVMRKRVIFLNIAWEQREHPMAARIYWV